MVIVVQVETFLVCRAEMNMTEPGTGLSPVSSPGSSLVRVIRERTCSGFFLFYEEE